MFLSQKLLHHIEYLDHGYFGAYINMCVFIIISIHIKKQRKTKLMTNGFSKVVTSQVITRILLHRVSSKLCAILWQCQAFCRTSRELYQQQKEIWCRQDIYDKKNEEEIRRQMSSPIFSRTAVLQRQPDESEGRKKERIVLHVCIRSEISTKTRKSVDDYLTI